MPPILIRMRGVFPGVHFRGLPSFLRRIRRREMMTHEITGFEIEPCGNNRLLFRRVSEPRHEYVFEITARRIVLRATLPTEDGMNRREALDDAERSEEDAWKAAEEFQRRTFGETAGPHRP